MIARERVLGCSHANNIDIPKPNFNINRFRADWNAFSGDDTVEVYYFERMPCSWSCSVLFYYYCYCFPGECVCVFLLLLLSPLAYYFSKHWNCLACNINNDDIKSIFDNGKCLIQSMAWYGQGIFTGHSHLRDRNSTWEIDNNSCQSQMIYDGYVLATSIQSILIACRGGRRKKRYFKVSKRKINCIFSLKWTTVT